MSGIVISLSLLVCLLVLSEACNKPAGSGTSAGYTQLPDSGEGDVYRPGSGPIPPHPFRRRRDDRDNSALNQQSEAISRMMQELFDGLDADGDRAVSESEWVKRRGKADDYRQVLADFDNNADGLLSFDEFLAASKS